MTRLVAVLLLALLPFTARSATAGDCSAVPADAVRELPAPLSEWGILACTPEGHILVGHPGWVWQFMETLKAFGLPAGFGQAASGDATYFTRIEMIEVPVSHPLAERAAATLNEGMSPDSTPWEKAYAAVLANNKEQGVSVYFFEKGRMRMGIMCDWKGMQCSTGHRFMVHDMRDRS